MVDLARLNAEKNGQTEKLKSPGLDLSAVEET